MDSEEKIQELTPIPLNTINDEINQRETTIVNIPTDNNNNIHTENNDHNITSITKSEKFEMINKIFLANSSFNKHTKEYFMTRFQIILLLQNSNIINDDIISKTQADLILTKLKPNQNKFMFVDFMNCLTEICKYIFKDNYKKNPKQYIISKILLKYFLIYYIFIIRINI